ncbi:MAG: RsmD family RNA methyltransferase [Planctomycetota bacterium]|nr:RsmD family RNA methyltransferase [Planctomycetota bacterium]
MRVIAGSARGVPLATPAGNETRPLPDRIKKSLFSILDARGRTAGAGVLDLYAGVGTVGIEALSRGAASCVFVERSAAFCRILRANLAKTRLEGAARVVVSTVEQYLSVPAVGADLVFLDPPFETASVPRLREDFEWVLRKAFSAVSAGGWMVLRMESRAEPFAADGVPRPFRIWEDGRQRLLFYEKQV